MEELVDVFMDANRLRRSVLSDIVNATDVYQAALFLESLAQFLVGFKDKKFLPQYEKTFPLLLLVPVSSPPYHIALALKLFIPVETLCNDLISRLFPLTIAKRYGKLHLFHRL
nr:protein INAPERTURATE POLLEN1 [Ipomoea batatas]